jgi:hypothetical protein
VKHGRPLRCNIGNHARQQPGPAETTGKLSRLWKHIPTSLHSAEIVTNHLPVCWAVAASAIAVSAPSRAGCVGHMVLRTDRRGRTATQGMSAPPHPSFQGAASAASPESMLTMPVVDSPMRIARLSSWSAVPGPIADIPADMPSRSRGTRCPSHLQWWTLWTMRGCRECRALAATHGPPAERNAGGSHHRSSRTSGIPCAVVLTLISCSSRCTGLVGHRRHRDHHPRRLSISVGMPEPHDFTSASSAIVVAPSASTAPRRYAS